jgi:hypothetical protein
MTAVVRKGLRNVSFWSALQSLPTFIQPTNGFLLMIYVNRKEEATGLNFFIVDKKKAVSWSKLPIPPRGW